MVSVLGLEIVPDAAYRDGMPGLGAAANPAPAVKLAPLTGDLSRVETALRGAVQTPDPFLADVAAHLIEAGGKRIRPTLALCATYACRTATPASTDAVTGAVAVELVHLGSLYHDDVIDESDTRRGVETVNAKWGNLQAILAGDFLLSRASEIAASLGTEIAGLLAHTIGRLCYGEIGQLRRTYSAARTEPEYLESIGGKTAALFSTAARIGAIVGGSERRDVEALTRYGHAFGMAFQMVDDVLDLTATEAQLGKPVGHDLVEGVYTLPVIRTLAAGGTAADELRDLLGRPLDSAECEKALAIVRSGTGVAEAVDVASHYVGLAEDACRTLPSGPATAALVAAPAALLAGVPG
jgi:heptaprenyl diphosphate synthase